MIPTIAEDRDPAPISEAAFERDTVLLCIEAEQCNWSWLLNPRRSVKPPSLAEGSSSDSEEELTQTAGEPSQPHIVIGGAFLAPTASVEGSEEEGDDSETIGKLLLTPLSKRPATRAAPVISGEKQKKKMKGIFLPWILISERMRLWSRGPTGK